MFCEDKVQEAVRVFLLHSAYPDTHPAPSPEQLNTLRAYLINWVNCFEGMDSLKAKLPTAQTTDELNHLINIMVTAGADPL
jgi:hypothetical protein